MLESGCFDVHNQVRKNVYRTLLVISFPLLLKNKVSCSNGYVFDEQASDAFLSLSMENGWLCDKGELGSNLLMAQQVGFILNSILFMHLSDT